MAPCHVRTHSLGEFEHRHLDPPITIRLPANLTANDLLHFAPFANWLRRLLRNLDLQTRAHHAFRQAPYRLREIDAQAADWFGPGKLGFVKVQAKVDNDAGEWLPGAVFLRGGSVAVLFVIHASSDPRVDSSQSGSKDDKLVRSRRTSSSTTPQRDEATNETPAPDASAAAPSAAEETLVRQETEEQQGPWVVLTVQPRIAAASLAFPEIPAGMLDGTGDFAGKAAQEIQEEVGVRIAAGDLFDMSALAVRDVPLHPWTPGPKQAVVSAYGADEGQKGETIEDAVYPSAGGCDEFIPLLLCQKRLSPSKIAALRGKATGLRGEGERITLKLVPLRDLWREGGRDAKALSALALYEALQREGKLPPVPDMPDDGWREA